MIVVIYAASASAWTGPCEIWCDARPPDDGAEIAYEPRPLALTASPASPRPLRHQVHDRRDPRLLRHVLSRAGR